MSRAKGNWLWQPSTQDWAWTSRFEAAHPAVQSALFALPDVVRWYTWKGRPQYQATRTPQEWGRKLFKDRTVKLHSILDAAMRDHGVFQWTQGGRGLPEQEWRAIGEATNEVALRVLSYYHGKPDRIRKLAKSKWRDGTPVTGPALTVTALNAVLGAGGTSPTQRSHLVPIGGRTDVAEYAQQRNVSSVCYLWDRSKSVPPIELRDLGWVRDELDLFGGRLHVPCGCAHPPTCRRSGLPCPAPDYSNVTIVDEHPDILRRRHRQPYLYYLLAVGLNERDAIVLCFDAYCRERDSGTRDLDMLGRWLLSTPAGADERVRRAQAKFYEVVDDKPAVAICEACGTEWRPQRKSARFCSGPCRAKANRTEKAQTLEKVAA